MSILISCWLIKWGGNLKKEWIVCPLALIAVIPWKARVIKFFLVFCLKYSNRVDLPDPALPVINKLVFVLSIKLKVSLNSLVNSKLSGSSVPVSSFM